MRRSAQDQDQIRQRILKAMEDVISQYGIQAVKVSYISQISGVGRTTIYRYFGGISGLLEAFVQSNKTFPHFLINIELNQLMRQKDADRIFTSQMIWLFRQFRASKASREIIKASLIENSSISSTVQKNQEDELLRLVQQLKLSANSDSQATLALLLSGLYYLTMRAHNDQPMLGLNLREEADWIRIEKALETVYNQFDLVATRSVGHSTMRSAQIAA